MKLAVIIPAAGVGRRFAEAADPFAAGAAAGRQPATSKIERDLAGRPVFLRSVELFLGRPVVAQVILAVNPDAVESFKFKWGDKLVFHGVDVVAGGRAERWETVLNALAAVKEGVTHVAVHDAARPLASAKLIDRVLEAAARHSAVIPALPVSNTLKRVVEDDADAPMADPLDGILGGAGKEHVRTQRVVETVPRAGLVEVQTPQVFELNLFRRAYAQISDGRFDAGGVTDDASLIEALGEPVRVVEGEPANLKITRPQDLEIALAIVEKRRQSEAATVAKKRLFADDDE
jgi:2-C-methyl-D-erythritol 4-phosphate cytidylyltransferase